MFLMGASDRSGTAFLFFKAFLFHYILWMARYFYTSNCVFSFTNENPSAKRCDQTIQQKNT